MHPFAELFHVLEGEIDFQRMGSDNKIEWVRCKAGEFLLVPINAPHGMKNRTEKPAKITSTSTYYHEVIFNEIQSGTKLSTLTPENVEQFTKISSKYQGYFIEAEDSERLVNN